MRYIINNSNKTKINTYLLNLTNESFKTFTIKHIYIENSKPFQYFNFYIQENNNRTTGILIKCPYDNIIENIQKELNQKCKMKYKVCEINGKLNISCDNNFNLVFYS